VGSVPLATLVQPGLWNLIGTTTPIDVPPGDKLTVTSGLLWPAATLPPAGHCCLIAMAGCPSDPMPPLPQNLNDWAAFVSFVRNCNNVAWCNIDVLALMPGGQWQSPLFYITGAGDMARRFDIELVQRLPPGAQVVLDVADSLTGALRGAGATAAPGGVAGRARILIPSQRSTKYSDILLPAGGGFESRLVIRLLEDEDLAGSSVAIRQIYQGIEVGRITWRFPVRVDARRASVR